MPKSPDAKPVLPSAPDGLSDDAVSLWDEVVADVEFSPAEERLLGEALHALDEARSARRVLAVDGLTVSHGTGAVKAHPLLDVEHRSRQFFAQAVKQLGLQLEDEPHPVPRAKPGPKTRVAPARSR